MTDRILPPEDLKEREVWRFRYEEDEDLRYFDEDGNEITLAEWEALIRRDSA